MIVYFTSRGGRCSGRRPPPRLGLVGREALAPRVLADRAGLEELQQVVGPTGLRADARHAEAAEGLTADDGAGDGSVDVDVAGPQLDLGLADVMRRTRVDAGGQRVLGVVGDGDGLL